MKAVSYEGPRKVSVSEHPKPKIKSPTDAEYLRDLIITGRAKPSQIVSHRIDINDVPKAYDKLTSGLRDTPKSSSSLSKQPERVSHHD